jgi:asparagine synthase (glutamine-hydrolysing)
MCGITGIYAHNEVGRFSSVFLQASLEELKKRGPDYQNSHLDYFVNLGHARLAIIDLNPEANQPFHSEDNRFTIVFNGEIYNFKQIKQELQNLGHSFHTQSDTEVLLKAYIQWNTNAFSRLNGFFAFAIYDKETTELILVRDRYGVKPLLYFEDEDKIVFASEMKALLKYRIPKEIDKVALYQYLQFNYIPAPRTILKGVKKLMPATFLKIKKREKIEGSFYQLPDNQNINKQISYQNAQIELKKLLDDAVKLRMVADVPLGCFLSGGIDSSVVTALASQHTEKLLTFSIGYKDEPFFDETKYAHLVAKKFNTEHTTFSLTNNDLYADLHSILDYIDEPFADSSAIAVNILSKYTRKKVTVALSGDGADELFSGYQKHAGEFLARSQDWKANIVEKLLPLWKNLPQSRNGFLSNKIRQFKRFAEGRKLTPQQRYWQWATFMTEQEALQILQPTFQPEIAEYQQDKANILRFIHNENLDENSFNEVLKTDLSLVLSNDMLVKVDLMSMAHALEVRSPFLDFRVMDFVSKLPVSMKIDKSMKKKILQDTFRDILPPELYKRPKHGFEVPLLKWFRTDLKEKIQNQWLNIDFIKEQGIFEPTQIQKIQQQLFSNSPADTHAKTWALIVFQNWWEKFFK